MKQDPRITKCNRSILRDEELLGWFGQVDLKEALKPVIERTIEIVDEMGEKRKTNLTEILDYIYELPIKEKEELWEWVYDHQLVGDMIVESK